MKSGKVLLAKNECPERSGKLWPITLGAIEAEMFWCELAANVEFTISCKRDEKIFDYYRSPSHTHQGMQMAETSAPVKPARLEISRPVFERTFMINSEQAIRVIRKSYDRLIKSLYAIDVILRIVGQEQAIDEIEAIVSTMIADCATQLQQEKARLEKLKADNGITETPTYTHPTEFVARIASPQIAQFVELIRLLDQLMIVMDTLWLCQVIDNKHCVEARYHWQQRLQRLANRIVTIERQAHRAAYVQGHGEEVRLARQESGLQDEPETISEEESEADESYSAKQADEPRST